ncbi:hypothetical protein ACFL59_04000, partial [Planctomycetota bacterium]
LVDDLLLRAGDLTSNLEATRDSLKEVLAAKRNLEVAVVARGFFEGFSPRLRGVERKAKKAAELLAAADQIEKGALAVETATGRLGELKAQLEAIAADGDRLAQAAGGELDGIVDEVNETTTRLEAVAIPDPDDVSQLEAAGKNADKVAKALVKIVAKLTKMSEEELLRKAEEAYEAREGGSE